MIVAGFAGRTDLGKSAETANEVRRVMKDLKDSQNQGALFNQRERLFGMQVTPVRTLCYVGHTIMFLAVSFTCTCMYTF